MLEDIKIGDVLIFASGERAKVEYVEHLENGRFNCRFNKPVSSFAKFPVAKQKFKRFSANGSVAYAGIEHNYIIKVLR